MTHYHYLLNEASLQITCSDSQQQHVDEERIPEVHDHPDGYKRYYVQQFNDTPLSKEWRKKLGRDLAIMFLLKPKSRNIDYILTKFPKGYKLFSHRKGVNHDVDRTDAYLYGDHHKFRSPAEFLPHAAWFIAGMPPGCCRCKYCNSGRGKVSQTKLNKQFKEGYKVAVNARVKQEYQARKDGRPYTPDDQPLVKVFLKPAPGPGQVLSGFNQPSPRIPTHIKHKLA